MRKYNNTIMAIPFVMLIMDGLSLFLYKYPFYDQLNLYFLNQITGHTLLALGFMLFYAVMHRFCMYSKVAIIGMAALNLYNIAYSVFRLHNYFMYAQIIILISILLSSIYLIKKLIK
jgi:hypothetical protein